MRLDHLLSKDRFVGVASWSFDLAQAVHGSGPARGLALAEELGGRPCLVGLFSRVGLACLVVGVGNTPAVVGCCGLVVVVVSLVVGAPACLGACGGGMLSGFWGSAPWLPGPCSAACLWVVGLGVGGLVVNCIVDASILL